MRSLPYRLGVTSVRRRWLVIAAWIIIVAAAALAGLTWGGSFVDDFHLPGSESEKADDLLEEEFPQQAGGSARIVFADDRGLQDSQARSGVESTLEAIAEQPHISFVGDPFSGREGAVSESGEIAFADVRYDRPLTELGTSAVDRLEDAAEVGRESGVQVELGGELLGFARDPETRGAEAGGVVAAAFILVLGFGSVIAAGLPIGLALGGLVTGLSLVRLLAAVFDISSVGLMLGTMIGLGVGIDYALFIVTRHREFLRDGAGVTEAVGRATATAGRAVVFAGVTVIIAITGLTVAGIPAVTLMGFSAALVVAVMVVASMTLLPALLGIAGDRINPLRARGRSRRKDDLSEEEHREGVWGRWGRGVERRPWLSLFLGLAIIAVLAAPTLSLDLAMPDGSMEPEGNTRREAHHLLEEGFGPGFNGPLLLALALPDSADGTESAGSRDSADRPDAGGGPGGPSGGPDGPINPEAAAAPPELMELRETLAGIENVAQVSRPMMSPTGSAAVLQITPATGPQADETETLVHDLRDDLLPETLDGTGIDAYVAGHSAMLIDFTDRTVERLPWFMLAVIGLSFVLLTLAFRSVVVPATAAIMNLFSIAAAYGVVVAVFQWGWGLELIGIEETTPVITFLPMLMFAILFGLSMDYEVFLLSRVSEEYQRGWDNAESVVRGLSATGRVITSAAAIMVVVFTGFVLGDDIAIKQVGLGLAAAILIDATLVRILLVPSSMVLIGDANWWMPRWLDRMLPDIDVEGEAARRPRAHRPQPVQEPAYESTYETEVEGTDESDAAAGRTAPQRHTATSRHTTPPQAEHTPGDRAGLKIAIFSTIVLLLASHFYRKRLERFSYRVAFERPRKRKSRGSTFLYERTMWKSSSSANHQEKGK